MGAAIGVSMNYASERRQLRQALIQSVINDEKNQDVLSNLVALRKIIVQHSEICATAAHEKENKFDHSATSTDAAWRELDRLFTVYETSRIFKSEKMRSTGPVACPLGHHAVLFENMKQFPGNPDPTKRKAPICNICEKKTESGYHCSYCQYNLCKMCSSVYCTWGHEMKLWTAGESDCSCVVCHTHPIYSGYRCTECHDYDICDYCTYKEGRAAIAATIMERMEDNLSYMRKHRSESYTSNHTLTNLKVTVGAGSDSFQTIWHLVQFSNELQVLRNTSVLEVVQSRISYDIMRLREILIKHCDLNMTAYREEQIQNKHRTPTMLISDIFFTRNEASRLNALVDSHLKAKSMLVRSKADTACPLGHVMTQFNHTPAKYMMYNLENGIYDENKSIPPLCKICNLVSTNGYHCGFCEYDLCKICKIMYCSEGHEMTMWTIPEARGQRCYVCSKTDLTQGYHCTKCFINLCDMCTRKERRLNVRSKWDEELQDLMQFMHDNRFKSDMAKFYNWRHHTQVISLGALCDLVRELRIAKYKAEKQIKFKVLIDKMKVIRADYAVNQDMSKLSEREANRNTGPDGYVYRTKRDAKAELRRLNMIIKRDVHCRGAQRRLCSGIACPLGHALCRLRDFKDRKNQPIKEKKVRVIKDDGNQSTTEAFAEAFADMNDDNDDNDDGDNEKKENEKNKIIDKDLLLPEDDPDIEQEIGPHGEIDVQYRDTSDGFCICKVCGLNARNGNTCPMCEYDLCNDCSSVYCRSGHLMNIWTLPEAQGISCDICMKTRITAGYRCIQCNDNVNICDRCTACEPRQAMKIWPKRDIRKLITYIESTKADSDIAMKLSRKIDIYLKEENMLSMSAICTMLNELRSGKNNIKHEIDEKRKVHLREQYALHNSDF